MIGGTRIHNPSATEEHRLCQERPDSGMGFSRMQRACVLRERHEGDHVSRDGTTFPRKAARRSRTVVTGSYVENMARRRLS